MLRTLEQVAALLGRLDASGLKAMADVLEQPAQREARTDRAGICDAIAP
jgi:hypothetical protein